MDFEGTEGIPVKGSHTITSPTLRTHPPNIRHESAHPSPLHSAIERGQRGLLARQQSDGHWVGELQGDTILESEYILLMAFLGRERDKDVTRAARYLLTQQLPE